jgi:SARP family transcriptional regulator, regulator of embCAB operon
VRYEVLGPLRLVDERGTRSISAQKIETLLGVLLARSNQLVSTDQLMTEIWGQTPPMRALAGIYVYISQLRKHIAEDVREEKAIITRPSGYMLRTVGDEVDVDDFLALIEQGRRLVRKEGEYEHAAQVLEKALDLWRGPVLGDVHGGPITSGFAVWLTETRTECLELLMDARLRLGLHRELVGRLYLLAAEYPLREAFHQQLMLALYRCGRQADALRAYQTVRGTLHHELGVEPGPELKLLHRAILTADASLRVLEPAVALA